jgi:hypothetical protein
MIYNNRIEVEKVSNGWELRVYDDDKLVKNVWADTGIFAHQKAKILFDYYGYTTILKSEYSGSSEKFVSCDRILYQGNDL